MPNSESPHCSPAPPDAATAPPQPLTVWRPAAGISDAHFGTAVASRLIATYTQPTGLLVGLDHAATTAQAAIWLSRRATLIVTDRNQQENLGQLLEPRLDPTRRSAIRVLYAPPHDRTAPLRQAPGRAELIVATVSAASTVADAASGLHRFLADCAAAIRPPGFVALQVPTVDTQGRFTDAITTVIAAAQGAGLRYHEHLIAIRDRLYPARLRPPAVCARTSIATHAAGRTHTDLLILAVPGAIYG